MGVSPYGNLNVSGVSGRMDIFWEPQSHGECYENSTIDPSVKGNRLRTRLDGSLEVVPKSPAEVLGERVVRPLLDTTYNVSVSTFQAMKGGWRGLNNFLSKNFNLLPGAEAQPQPEPQAQAQANIFDLVSLQEAFKAWLAKEGLRMAFESFSRLFYNDAAYKQAHAQYEEAKEAYKRAKEDSITKLKACKDQHNDCYIIFHTDCSPEIFKVDSRKDGEAVPIQEWRVTEGYLYWSIYIDGWFSDASFETGGYNYDMQKKKPNVKTRTDF